MTHEEAAHNRAAERYLLRELSPVESEQFEEHFFDCADCAEEVRVGAAFVANARAVFAGTNPARAESPRPTVRRSWISGLQGWWRPAFASAMAAAVVLLIANLALLHRVGSLGAPQSYPAFFLHGTARGDEQVLAAPASARFLGLSLDLPPEYHLAGYRCALVDTTGRTRWSVDVAAPTDALAPVNVLLPLPYLTSGRYTLILSGAGKELSRYPFVLQIQ